MQMCELFHRSLSSLERLGSSSPRSPSTISFSLLSRLSIAFSSFSRADLVFSSSSWGNGFCTSAFALSSGTRVFSGRSIHDWAFFSQGIGVHGFRRELRCPGRSCVCFRGTGERGQKTFHPFLFPERYAMMINRITRKGRVRHARRAAPPAQ